MHYLDHAATTPVLPEALEAMLPFYRESFGNPSSVHAHGRRARAAVDQGRDRVAAAIGANPAEIVFTAGGSEADNLALKGVVGASTSGKGHIVVSTFEHHAVLGTAEWLAARGVEVSEVAVDHSGVVDSEDVAAAVRPSTALVSIMAVNNEIGTVQPVQEIVAAVKSVNPDTLVHTDAVQALGNIAADVESWGVDLAAFSAHKLGGPKGVGALYVRSGTKLEAQIHGGGQERGLRSGTSNVPGIAGFGVAAQIAAREWPHKSERTGALRTRLLDGIRAVVPDVVVNGDLTRRISGNLNVCIPAADAETMLMLLDRAGISCSSGSACQSGAVDPSHVLLAIGVEPSLARGSLRFSLGRDSTPEDVEALLAVLPDVVQRASVAA